MADIKVTELPALLSADAADADVVMIVNADADISNKMLVSELRSLITNALVIGVDVQAYSAILDATTASYTTALDTKLDGIEANADVTDADNVNSSGAVMESDYTPAFSLLVQQSGTGSPESLSVATGTIVGRTTSGGSEIDDLSPTQVRLLLNVEDGADVTDTTNVTNAGALMDSEVTNLAQVKAFDSTDYAAALGADDNYVTDAEKIVIGNTSGTNTGDQDISGKQDILSEGAFVDGDKTKLDGIETGADVTDATNVAATGAVIPTGTPDGTKFLRDDEVWTTIPGGGDALTSNPLSQFASTTSLQLLGVISDETGTGALVFSTSPTLVTPNLGTPSVLVGTNITGTAAGLTVGATTGVEPGADVTDTANVTAAGALMDSEVVNLAQVKAFDSADYATAAQGTTADNALPTTGGTLTGDLTIVDTTSGSAAGPELTLTRDITGADGNYLGQLRFLGNNDIDQSNVYAKITAKISDATDTTEDGLIEFALRKDGSNAIVGRLTSTDLKLINGTGLEVDGDIIASGTVDGRDVATDGTKLDTIETNADVTDTANVTAAGALMDSELASITDVKALNQSLVSGAAPVLDATNFTNLPSATPSGSDTEIQFNDSGAFGASSNFVWDNSNSRLGIGATPTSKLHVSDAAGGKVVTIEGSLPELWFKDTFGGGSGLNVIKYNNQLYLSNTNAAGTHLNYASNTSLSTGKWNFGDGTSASGQVDIRVQQSATVGQRIMLANSQSANAFEINSFGGSGGNLFRVEDDGSTIINSPLLNLTHTDTSTIRCATTGTNKNTTFRHAPTGTGGAYWDNEGVGTISYFRVSNTVSHDTTAMTILSNGLIGIGTTTPASSLEVRARASGDVPLSLYNTNGGTGNLIDAYRAGSTTLKAFYVTWEGVTYQNLLGVSKTPSTDQAAIIYTATAARAGLRIDAATAQTANLTEWRDINDIVLTAVDASGSLVIGADTATAALDIDADLFRLRQSKTPSSASDTGDVGSICWDSGYIYICTATNTWERAAIATW